MESKEKENLIRICLSDDKLYLDPKGNMDGRGAYLCKNSPECLEKALKRKSFNRVFKTNISDIEEVETMYSSNQTEGEV